jgi:membrane protease YdiL (CAAX protease family)
MWILTGHEWRALPSEGWMALGLRRMAFIGGSGIMAGLGVVVLDHQRIFAGLILPGHRPQPVMLTLLVMALAFVNALGEELLWRAILEFETIGSDVRWRVVLQVGSFGIAHWHGLPSGMVGMLAAGAYSGFLYRVRRDTGFIAALTVHVLTDIVIFWFVARYALFRWTG